MGALRPCTCVSSLGDARGIAARPQHRHGALRGVLGKPADPKNWDGYVLEGGRFYVIQTAPRQVQLNCPGVVELEILIAR